MAGGDSNIGGGGGGHFPPTHWSAVLAARSDDPGERSRALDLLIAAYWKPVYKYIRIRWNKPREDAQDLTQEFFTRVIEKGFLDRYDPAKARLRTFLRVCVDGMVANEAKAAGRLKRGGDAVHLSLDFDSAETELGRAEAARLLQLPDRNTRLNDARFAATNSWGRIDSGKSIIQVLHDESQQLCLLCATEGWQQFLDLTQSIHL